MNTPGYYTPDVPEIQTPTVEEPETSTTNLPPTPDITDGSNLVWGDKYIL